MHEIIFFDLDGTLRDEVYGIPDTARTALERCRKNGLRVCLCTGRTLGTIPDDAAALHWDCIIAGNGCYIALGETVLKDAAFQTKNVQVAKAFLLAQKDAAYAFETTETVYMNRGAVEILRGMNEEKWSCLPPKERQKMREAQKINCEDNIRSFSPDIHRTGKLCLWADGETLQRVWDIFAGEPPKLCRDASFGDRRCWELIKADNDKGDAVRQVCSYLKIPTAHALAFGDGANDLNMFHAAGTSVAMQGGDMALLDYADAVCETPMENGIYLELKRRRLI